MRIALLHLAPRVGDIAFNRRLVETGIIAAAGMRADWVVTPELCLTGYELASFGKEWIAAQSGPAIEHFRRFAANKKVTLFLGHVEQDATNGELYNSIFVIASDGAILGTHRKHCVIPGAEAWASRGKDARAILVPPVPVGLLVCADAYTSDVAGRLRSQGAQLLISSAAWAPRPHGPERCWEERTRETGIPLFVCNRTGKDQSLDFREAESVVVQDGERLVSFSGPDSSVLLLDWNLENQKLTRHEIRKLQACPLCGGDNGCGLTSCEADAKAECWCFNEGFPRALLARVPPESVNRSCICLSCVRAFKQSSLAEV